MAAARNVTPPKFNDITGAIRMLAVDAVQKANSGHPGAPMGMAEIAEVLWNHHLRHNPANPKWADRDRFVQSNGHGSMLIYALLHLTGYDLPIDELKRFRQMHSKTPGHPEYGYTVGVETTTGPLGQGITNAVGMAMAEKLLANEFNKPGHEIVNHHTYVFMGDGCMMEGISHEACALAGTWGLGKLIAFWDDNNISIDGHIDGWFTDDTPKRFEAYGWHVIADVQGHDPEEINKAINAAKAVTDKPTLICCKTIIGVGSPNKAGTHDVHGAALGDDEVAATREHIGWKYPPFEIPAHVYEAWDARTKGEGLEKLWNNKFAEYKKAFPKEAAEFQRRMKGELPANWAEHAAKAIAAVNEKAETIATRKASQNSINALVPALPEFLGGSADLTGSNLTNWTGAHHVSAKKPGNYISYGVREFGMSHIMNGMALHGGLLPFGGTFLMFSEYARNALRMSALMKQRVIYVFTHDSIGLGEDGPTHQPVEQTTTLALHPQHGYLASVRHRRVHGVLGMRGRAQDRPVLADFQPPESGVPEARCETDRKHPQGWLRFVRSRRRQAAGDHHRHRFRSGSGHEGTGHSGSRRRQGARGVDAVDQRVRPPGSGLQGQRIAQGHQARGC